MTEHYKQSSFKQLLEKLQEESWQLELIISGFAIYGLFVAYEPISISVQESQNEQQVYAFIISSVALVSCAILIFNLLLHVILRGLWIGALGLRYVSGDIDYDQLNYSRKFNKYLRKKVGSFDKYIANLENYCSIIFAISFLLIFYVLALTIIIIAIALIGTYLLDNDVLPGWFSKGFGIALMLFVVLGMFLTFIDFITLGWLKKKNWISVIYFPIYWVFSFLTLSFLYRPLVYNFLDNKFGRRLSLLLVPIFFVILILTSLNYRNSNYLDSDISSNSIYANSQNYEDEIDEDDEFIRGVAIPSKVIANNYLKVFIHFSENIESRVFGFNEGLRPEKDRRGLQTDIQFNSDGFSSRERDSLRREYIRTFNEIYRVKIDSVEFESEFILAQGIRSDLGFETYIGIKELSEGKHMLNVSRKSVREEDTTWWRVANIPFWYYPD